MTRARAVLALTLLAAGGLSRGAAAQGNLGDGTLLVAGTTLAISPESQTVRFDTPTIVQVRSLFVA